LDKGEGKSAIRIIAGEQAEGMEVAMSLYQRGKSWYYDFKYRGERYTGCIGAVSKTVAKEIMAKKKAEAVEGRYELPSKKPTPKLEEFAKEYFAYSITGPIAVRARQSGMRRRIAPCTLHLAMSG
jgi:hypothetical protein